MATNIQLPEFDYQNRQFGQEQDMFRKQQRGQVESQAALLRLLGLDASVKTGMNGSFLNTRGSLVDTPIFQQLLGKSGPGGGGGGIGGGGEGGDLFNQQLADIDSFGASQRSRIQSDAKNSIGTALARMSDRGLGSSNLDAAAQSQVDQVTQQSLLGLEDARLGQRIGAIGSELDRRQQSRLQLQGQGMNLVGSLLGMLRS